MAPRGDAHRARPEGARALPAPDRRLPADLDDGQHRRGADRARSATRSATRGQAICGLSGGVDSAVAAAVVQRAIGDRLTCVFVDHGLLRKGEAEQVERDFVAATGVDLHVVDAEKRFLDALAGVSDPEEKRKIIGREFIRVFEAAEAEVLAEPSARRGGDKVAFLVQGTLYPDVVESGGGAGTSNIKSHHNVGGLPDDLEFELVEPLRTLFKDEVRLVGEQLGLPAEIVWRHPFPGPGLGIRIIGEVTRERLDILREADAIAREELTRAGLDRDIWQFPVVLLADVRSVGVQGDGRTYGHPVVLRPVTSEDAMTADWARLPYDVLETHLDPDHQRGPRGQPGHASTSPASRPAPSSGSRARRHVYRSLIVRVAGYRDRVYTTKLADTGHVGRLRRARRGQQRRVGRLLVHRLPPRRLPRAREGNREAKRSAPWRGTVHQVLVYDDGALRGLVPVRLAGRAAEHQEPGGVRAEATGPPDWRIGCIFTGSKHRGKGVAAGRRGGRARRDPGAPAAASWRPTRSRPRNGSRSAAPTCTPGRRSCTPIRVRPGPPDREVALGDARRALTGLSARPAGAPR